MKFKLNKKNSMNEFRIHSFDSPTELLKLDRFSKSLF